MATVILLRRNRIILTIPNKEKLSTPQNVSFTDTSASWDEVANATEYEIVVGGTSWGDYTPSTSAYDYAFDESTGVLALNNAPHSQSGDTLTIL